MTVVHLYKVGLVKNWLKLLGENRRVVGGDTERDCRTDVAEDGIANRVGHLGDVLVGNGKIKPILPGFGKNDGEAISSEVLELINIEIEWSAVGNVWYV